MYRGIDRRELRAEVKSFARKKSRNVGASLRIAVLWNLATDIANSFVKGRERVRGDLPMQRCAIIIAASYERLRLTCLRPIFAPLLRVGKSAPHEFV